MQNERAVEKWLNLSSNSEYTGQVYLHRIGKFCKMCKVDLNEILGKWKEVKYDLKEREEFLEDIRDKIDEFHALLKKEGYSPNYIANCMASVCSFCKHNRIPIGEVSYPQQYAKYHNRDITKEEIKTILQHSSLRERTFYLMMLQSGLRPHTLLRLRYKHIKEDYEANKTPCRINTPRDIIKGKYVDGRFSFIGREALDSLREYLKKREPLNDDDLIFTTLRRKRKADSPYLAFSAISGIFDRAVEKLGIAKQEEFGKPKQIHLYNLRKYFRNNARCDPHYIQFWMAHKLDNQDEAYISRDPERHREEYMKAYQHLTINESKVVPPELVKEELSKIDFGVMFKDWLKTTEGRKAILETLEKEMGTYISPGIKESWSKSP